MSLRRLQSLVRASVLFASALVFTACGSPAIEPGDYDVEIEYTRDDWPGGEVGKITQATWRIEEKEGDYTMEVVGPSFNYEGKELGDKVVFKKDGKDCVGSRVVIEIHATGDQAFRGDGEIETYMCGSSNLWVTANMKGKLRKSKD